MRVICILQITLFGSKQGVFLMLQIITDSASDITLEQAARMNVHIVPIRIEFDDGVCPQESERDFGIFYDRLEKAKELPVTSQPSPELYLQYFNAAKEAGDEVLVLALSSGLSGTINGINVAKEMCDYDPIYILDSRQAIAGQRVLVEHAVILRDAGVPTERIITELEKLRDRISIIGVIDTLEYLKKGGRIPASLGMLGNALQIKPVIILEDRILKTVGKALGHAAGKRQLCSRFENELPDPNFPIYFLYSSNRQMGEEFMREMIQKYALQQYKTQLLPVGGVIGTHVGTNCIGICYISREKIG